MQGQIFRNVLIDEAGQTTELATLVPLMHLHAQGSAVLVGDHRQLPATVACLEADVEGLGTSLFERLTSFGVPPMLLDMQYRMHPALAAFPSTQYYGGRLRSGVPGAKRPPVKGISWPVAECPIAFMPVAGAETLEGTSYLNLKEVAAINEVLGAVIKAGNVRGSDIGIITPYAAQARAIKAALGIQGGKPVPGVQQPEVSSVDGFQGREKELIFVSCVRANERGKVGFMGDPRRLNVMLTRAKRGLVVFGHFDTLGQDTPGWRPWLSWVQERGLIVGCEATSKDDATALKALHSLTIDQLAKTEVQGIGAEGLAAENAADEAAAGGAAGVASAGAGAEAAAGPRKRAKSRLMQAREEAGADGAPKKRRSLLMQVREDAAKAAAP